MSVVISRQTSFKYTLLIIVMGLFKGVTTLKHYWLEPIRKTIRKLLCPCVKERKIAYFATSRSTDVTHFHFYYMDIVRMQSHIHTHIDTAHTLIQLHFSFFSVSIDLYILNISSGGGSLVTQNTCILV